MKLTEKAAYLKGLVEGLGVEEGTKEGKILKAIVDLLDDISLSVADLEDGYDELSEQIDIIDEDLSDLEEDLYGDDEEDDEEDDEMYEVVCPSCGDEICINESILADGEMTCPNCGEKLEFDLDDLDEAEAQREKE